MRLTTLAGVILLLHGGAALAGGGMFDDMGCRHSAPRKVATPAAGISRVVIHADS